MSTVLTLKIPKGAEVLRGHDHIWTVIMMLGRDSGEFTRPQVEGETNGHGKAVSDYMSRLVKAGYISVVREVSQPGSRHPLKVYRLDRTARHAPQLRRDGTECSPTGQQAMWNILRGPQGRPGVDARELRELVHQIGGSVTERTATTFLTRLHSAGYLQIVRPASNGGGLAAYRLLPARDTGPKPPMILRAKLVFDPNSKEIVGKPEAQEVAG